MQVGGDPGPGQGHVSQRLCGRGMRKAYTIIGLRVIIFNAYMMVQKGVVTPASIRLRCLDSAKEGVA